MSLPDYCEDPFCSDSNIRVSVLLQWVNPLLTGGSFVVAFIYLYGIYHTYQRRQRQKELRFGLVAQQAAEASGSAYISIPASTSSSSSSTVSIPVGSSSRITSPVRGASTNASLGSSFTNRQSSLLSYPSITNSVSAPMPLGSLPQPVYIPSSTSWSRRDSSVNSTPDVDDSHLDDVTEGGPTGAGGGVQGGGPAGGPSGNHCMCCSLKLDIINLSLALGIFGYFVSFLGRCLSI